jgi:signal transduction histidine kinase
LLALETELEGLGASVTRALSGEAALQLVNDADFALILLDVQLPGMNGIEVARRFRSSERTAQTPIIFITAYDQDDRDVLAAYELAAVDFLFKPLRLEVLRAKVKVFINLSRQAEVIREHERREHARTLEAARHQWEEESLRRERDQFAELDRKKDRFLAMIGHELRTPLAPLLTGLEVLKEWFAEDPQVDERVVRMRDLMHRQVDHLIQLVDDLLDVSRINSDKLRLSMEKLRVQDVVEQAVATSRPLIDQKEQTVVLDIGEQPLVVQGDLVRLVQIVANLLNNAARYTPAGGKIRISCSPVDSELELCIVDNGMGIEKDALSRIFEPFVQEERHRSAGLGLGLAIVHRLVLLHGGTVTAHSEGPGLGSEFVVRLPLDCQATTTQRDAVGL